MAENVKFSNDYKTPFPSQPKPTTWQMPDKYPRPPVGMGVDTLGDDSEN